MSAIEAYCPFCKAKLDEIEQELRHPLSAKELQQRYRNEIEDAHRIILDRTTRLRALSAMGGG